MYICVGQKVHNIIFIFYFYIGKTKLEKKRRGTWKGITDTSNVGKNQTQTKTNVKKTEANQSDNKSKYDSRTETKTPKPEFEKRHQRGKKGDVHI